MPPPRFDMPVCIFLGIPHRRFVRTMGASKIPSGSEWSPAPVQPCDGWVPVPYNAAVLQRTVHRSDT